MKSLMLALIFIAGSAAATPAKKGTDMPSTLNVPEVPATAGKPETPVVPEPQGALINAKDRRHQVSTVCRKDQENFCRNVKGPAKIKKCLAAHHDQLSADCRAVVKLN